MRKDYVGSTAVFRHGRSLAGTVFGPWDSGILSGHSGSHDRSLTCVCVWGCFVEMSAQEEAQKADGGLEASVSHLKR